RAPPDRAEERVVFCCPGGPSSQAFPLRRIGVASILTRLSRYKQVGKSFSEWWPEIRRDNREHFRCESPSCRRAHKARSDRRPSCWGTEHSFARGRAE